MKYIQSREASASKQDVLRTAQNGLNQCPLQMAHKMISWRYLNGHRCKTADLAAPFKVYVCSRLPAGIVGLNSAKGTDVYCECCVLSGRGLCDELITHPKESYRLWCVVCDLENLKAEKAMASVGLLRHGGGGGQT